MNSVNKGAAVKVNTDSDPFDEGNSPSAVKVNMDSDPFDEGNSPSAVKINTDSDQSDERNSPSAVKVNTDSDPSDKGETSGGSSNSLGYWDYVTDRRYSTDEIPFSANQPCGCMRGVSFTPPGWMRKPKTRKCTKKSKPPAAKRINLD